MHSITFRDRLPHGVLGTEHPGTPGHTGTRARSQSTDTRAHRHTGNPRAQRHRKQRSEGNRESTAEHGSLGNNTIMQSTTDGGETTDVEIDINDQRITTT